MSLKSISLVLATLSLYFLVLGCDVTVEATPAPMNDTGSVGGAADVGLALDADAGRVEPVDAGGPPVRCTQNEDCWFGAGCYRSHCMDPELITGNFERTPITNDWHIVTVSVDRGELLWSNEAGANWDLEIRDGELWTKEDCPYGVQALQFDGDHTQVNGLYFQDELYERVD